MRQVEALLAGHLEDDETVFVFPSEVTTVFWRRRALAIGTRRSIRERRFLSWDRFKEGAFKLTRAERPANAIERSFFAAGLLEENASGSALFRALIHPSHARNSSAFLKSIVSILPQLERCREAIRASGGALRPDIRGDLDLLHERYEAFLSANGLFEPSDAGIDLSRLEGTYYLFFPEVIEDYRDFQAQLRSPRLIAVPIEPGRSEGSITRFANVVQEERFLAAELADLLDSGVEPSEIAVTVADLDARRERLRIELEARGIPVDIRQGRPLSEYPAGRLFSALAACETDGFSLEALKRLLLDRALPWRDRDAASGLVRFGIEFHCDGAYRASDRSVDLWEANLKRTGGGPLLAFYSSLRRDVREIVSAPGFAALRARLADFTRRRLDVEGWEPASRRVFQYCLDSLGDFVEAEEAVAGARPPSAFRLWLSLLGERIYVERSEAAGVPVYPYRVAGGIAPAHHFVVGASQRASRVELPAFPFLREDQREALGLPDRSFSDAFLALYLQSGASVRMSLSREDLSGPELAPGFFVSRRAVRDSDDSAALKERDPLARELEVWSGGRAPDRRVLPAQKAAIDHLSWTAWTPRRLDLAAEPLRDEDLRSALVGRLSDDAGRLAISPTGLEAYRSCPFAFLFSALLGVEERDFEIPHGDARLEGKLLHRCLAGLFELLRSEPRDSEGLVERAVEEGFAAWETDGPLLLPPEWSELKRRAREQLAALLRVDTERFPDYRVADIERVFTIDGPAEGIALDGRVDRVSLGPDGALVVDYKRHRHPTLAEIAGSQGESPSSFQIPFYVHLLKRSGVEVAKAGYYDLAEGSYAPVFDVSGGRKVVDRDGMEKLLAVLERSVLDMSEALRAGSYLPPDLQAGCAPCSLRSVCRMRYAVR